MNADDTLVFRSDKNIAYARHESQMLINNNDNKNKMTKTTHFNLKDGTSAERILFKDQALAIVKSYK